MDAFLNTTKQYLILFGTMLIEWLGRLWGLLAANFWMMPKIILNCVAIFLIIYLLFVLNADIAALH